MITTETDQLPRKFWNEYAKSYLKVEKLYPHKKMLDAIAALIPVEANSIIDVACGTGALLEKLRNSRKGVKLYGVDFSSEMLKVASDRVSGLSTEQYDINNKLPYGDETFCCVISSNAIYALNNPKKFVNELLRLTKPGGLVILTSPKAEASAIRIYLHHWKNVGFLQGLIDLVNFIPNFLYNFLIVRKARSQKYHFLSKEEIASLHSNIEIHQDTFAGQNWLVSIRK